MRRPTPARRCALGRARTVSDAASTASLPDWTLGANPTMREHGTTTLRNRRANALERHEQQALRGQDEELASLRRDRVAAERVPKRAEPDRNLSRTAPVVDLEPR